MTTVTISVENEVLVEKLITCPSMIPNFDSNSLVRMSNMYFMQRMTLDPVCCVSGLHNPPAKRSTNCQLHILHTNRLLSKHHRNSCSALVGPFPTELTR